MQSKAQNKTPIRKFTMWLYLAQVIQKGKGSRISASKYMDDLTLSCKTLLS